MGGLVLGVAGRWLYDRPRPAIAKPAPAANWDLWLLGLFAALAIFASAAE